MQKWCVSKKSTIFKVKTENSGYISTKVALEKNQLQNVNSLVLNQKRSWYRNKSFSKHIHKFGF